MNVKAVIVVSESLPVGAKANIAAVMGMSLGKHRPELVGDPVTTSDNVVVPGITRIPIPVLTVPDHELSVLWRKGMAIDLVVPFTDAALSTKTYDDYAAKLTSTPSTETALHGLLLIGDKKAVNGIVGQLPLLR